MLPQEGMSARNLSRLTGMEVLVALYNGRVLNGKLASARDGVLRLTNRGKQLDLPQGRVWKIRRLGDADRETLRKRQEVSV